MSQVFATLMLHNKQLQNLFHAYAWSDSLNSRLWMGITSPHDSRSQTEGVMIIWSKFFTCWMVEAQENCGNSPCIFIPQFRIGYCHFSVFIPLVRELWLPSKTLHDPAFKSVNVWFCSSDRVKGWKKL